VRRFIVIVAAIAAVLAGAISASASTARPAPRLAPRAESAGPARHTPVLLAADIAAAKKGAAQAVLARLVAQHAAHLAHSLRSAHTQHLHLLHTRQLAVWASRAEAKAHAVQLATAVPVHHEPSRSGSSETAPALAGTRYTGGSGFQQCVIARESGGNSQVMNGSGHYGLYQFDAGTWASGGGNPADFGHASVAEQNQVFNSVYAARGSSPWAPSDGCTTAAITGAPATNATLLALVVRSAAPTAAHLAHLAHLHHLHVLHLAQLAKAHAVLTAVVGSSRGAAALRWAVANASGHAYLFGGTGPSYDCSGLVMTAFSHEGVTLPRTTEGMLASSHLVRVSSPAPGDLAFFGSGHVEFYAGPDETFGAHHSGTTISYRSYGPGYEPTGFYRVS
jgi:NlpC/P60 family/Transglycosylase-like domain